MKKLWILLIIIFFPFSVGANMADPGDTFGYPKSASSIISNHVDIIHEDIIVTANKGFKTALFNITYFIKANKSGIQIPMIFYASEFRQDFMVFVNGKQVSLKNMPESLQSRFTLFDDFHTTDQQFSHEMISRKHPGSYSDLKYFEIDLTKGSHTIEVRYTADVTSRKSIWMNKYGVRYELWPAKHWKSFGTLTIILKNNSGKALQTNLGNPGAGNLKTEALWKFNSLPQNSFTIELDSELSWFANTLISIGPEILSLPILTLIPIYHVRLIKRYRLKKPKAYFSWVAALGSFIACFLGLLAYLTIIRLIGLSIGESYNGNYPGGYGGLFIIFILCPFINFVYLIIVWRIDRTYVKKLKLKETQQ